MLQVFAEGSNDAEAKVALAIPPARALSNDLWDALRERQDEFSEVAAGVVPVERIGRLLP
jgi:hypothetical protein